MKQPVFIYSVFGAILLLLTSCSNYTFTSNINKDKITNYFAPSYVRVYNKETQLPTAHQYIAMVEGESCQQKASDALANKAEARTTARRKAYKLKANAVVFSKCVELKTKQCNQLLICYAQAYQVSGENNVN
jgi:RcsF protein